ncbi:hypothetical protein N801_03965 [Knoellia aerolata DSM 18566]|uniref:Uncharacterized protein n=1 Tax=Knoellia aerolata DSM 18566 TaxID=1385519 RepID=A0A0A0JWM2_9MICO|nr:hypothetical protein N801_03965 [Knoellia aerolata DSM 18566]
MVAVGEAGQVTDLDQEPCGAGGADAVQAQQRSPVAATRVLSSLSAAFLRVWIRSRSAASSAATRLAPRYQQLPPVTRPPTSHHTR